MDELKGFHQHHNSYKDGKVIWLCGCDKNNTFLSGEREELEAIITKAFQDRQESLN